MCADVAVKELEGLRESEAVTAALREAEFERVQREGVETSLNEVQVGGAVSGTISLQQLTPGVVHLWALPTTRSFGTCSITGRINVP